MSYIISSDWRVGQKAPTAISSLYWLIRNTAGIRGLVLLGNIVEPFSDITPDAFSRGPAWRDLLGPGGLLPDLAQHGCDVTWIPADTDAFMLEPRHEALRQAIRPITVVESPHLLPPNSPSHQLLLTVTVPEMKPRRPANLRQRVGWWLAGAQPAITTEERSAVERGMLVAAVASEAHRLCGVVHPGAETYCGTFGAVAAASLSGPDTALFYDDESSEPLHLVSL